MSGKVQLLDIPVSIPDHILVEQTVKQFGYDPRRLSVSSEKLVMRKCSLCGSVEPVKSRHARRQTSLCLKCSNSKNAISGASKRSIAVQLAWTRINHPRLGKSHTSVSRKLIGLGQKGTHHSPTHIAKVANALSRRTIRYSTRQKHRNRVLGRKNPNFGHAPAHTRKVWYVQKDGSRICFRSTWEAAVATYFDSQNVEWLYEPISFDLGNCSYIPDFFLPHEGKYIEVKGFWRRGYREKYDLFVKLHPDKPIEVWERLKLTQMGLI